jgi:rhodanese-related sulfurtransferase
MNEQDKPIAFVEPQKLRELMVADERVVIVDVRAAEEYASGHADEDPSPGARRSEPLAGL